MSRSKYHKKVKDAFTKEFKPGKVYPIEEMTQALGAHADALNTLIRSVGASYTGGEAALLLDTIAYLKQGLNPNISETVQ